MAAAVTTTTVDQVSEHINAPLKVINRIYESHRGTVGDGQKPSEFSSVVRDHFQAVLSKPGVREQIPIFDLSGDAPRLKRGSLVRFRCMVQDPSYGEELHLSVAQLVNTATGETKLISSQYTDADHVLEEGWEVDYASASNMFTEREVAYCVSVPGQNEWARLDSPVAALEGALGSLNISTQPALGGSSELVPVVAEKKYPLSGCKHSAALVKFYSLTSPPKVTSVVDAVGIYELGRSPRGEQDDTSEQHDSWPCIHAILVSEISVDSLVPDLPRPGASEHFERRSMCLAHLQSVLGGDDLAAHYLLLHLLSKTVAVQDVKVGKLSLNLIGFPLSSKSQEDGTAVSAFALRSPATQWVSEMLAQLVPRSVEMPFELATLNSSSFLPNAEGGDLQAGVLQLAPDSEIVCDETCLHEGTLDERGLRNLQALQTVILDQTLTYVYPYQPIDMATNLRVLVLSNGKSILQNDCDLYLSDEAVIFFAGIHEGSAGGFKPLDPMHTEQIRQYLELARHLDFGVPQDVSDAISDEYARMRREAHEKGEKMMTQAELALIVTVARLVSIGKSEVELSMDSWREAVDLEARRGERNAQAKAARSAK